MDRQRYPPPILPGTESPDTTQAQPRESQTGIEEGLVRQTHASRETEQADGAGAAKFPRFVPSPQTSPPLTSATLSTPFPSSPAFTYAAAPGSQNLDGVLQHVGEHQHDRSESHASSENWIAEFEKLFPACATKSFPPTHPGIRKLKDHIQKCHAIPENYECSRCGLGFTTEATARVHAHREMCRIRPRKIGQIRVAELTNGSREGPILEWVEKWIAIFCLCFPEFEEQDAAGITYWFVPVVEHFELESHLMPRPSDNEASFRLQEVQSRVCNEIDPVDGNVVEHLANTLAEYYQDVFARACANRPCYDMKFRTWVMSNDFPTECLPSSADLWVLLTRHQLSLSPTRDMYMRIASIFGPTCRYSAELRNRDSAISVGNNGIPSEDDGVDGDSDREMTGADAHTGTVNPQNLTLNGVNHDGIGGTQSSRRQL
ncbi:hypothetical protein QBC47DRAFT_418738 [Echria macrotheca]|uniref:C2H2-type domain-containing protein n=1 Tax=Echria macrotheca TaxID=438768 RepID=A0AAJ0B0Y4_9PEZI|nr:hypothetical protein QBC47DRAFT_418738 [Echria macrotheca]